MITENMMYWITRLDHIHLFCVVAGVVLAICTVFFILVLMHMTEGDPWKRCLAVIGFCALGAVVSSAVVVFIPTTREMVAIKVIPLLANDEEVQNIGKDVKDLAKEWIEELRPGKKDTGQ